MVTQSLGDEHCRSVPTGLLQGLLCTVAGVTIAVALGLAATERFLLMAIVCLAGLLPAGLLAFALRGRSPRFEGVELVELTEA